jgi:RNA polymerase sigma-70 factor, ECF subfamily
MAARFRPVSATSKKTTAGRSDGVAGTLGDLLYSDKTKAVASEQEWVQIVQAIGRRNQLALHALYERAHRPVFTLIMRIMNNRATAEELTLDVFHDVWQRAPQYDPAGGSVLGWIMNQARSRAIDRLRFEQRKKRVNPYPNGEPSSSDAAADEPCDDGEQRRLREALTLLTADEREAIETAFLRESTYAEVAARLNQPLGTVKTRIRSGLGKLRQALAKRDE